MSFLFNHGKESCIIDILITDFIKVTAVWPWLVCTPPDSYNDSEQVVVTLHFPFIFPPSLGFFCSLFSGFLTKFSNGVLCLIAIVLVFKGVAA